MTKHILVVDDNILIRKAMCEMILGDERLAPCTQAENGLEGVQKATEMHPDLIVMDYSMPVMNGLEASKRIRALMPAMKIIMVSLHEGVLDKAKLAQYGISAAVPKQQAATHLLPAICSLLGLTCAAGAA
jgi:two-component system, NarL family, nitrate/nitrite response regulator NarL